MAVIAAGARYDPVSQTIQETVVVIEEDLYNRGRHGVISDIDIWKLRTAALGHRWVHIPPLTYTAFTCPEDKYAFLSRQIGLTFDVNGFSVTAFPLRRPAA